LGHNLLYGARLSESAEFIKNNQMTETDVVDFLMSSPEVIQIFGVEKSLNITEFTFLLELTPGLLRNAHARLIYAAGLLLADQESLAASLLDELIPALNKKMQ